MQKRVLSILCAFAIVLGMVIPSAAFAVTDTTCDCGATNVEWITLTASTVLESGKHYRLEGNVELSDQYSISTDGFVACIDLAGHKLFNNGGRAFLLGASNGSAAVELNIMDSSANKTGRVEGQSKSSSTSGGVCYLYAGATLNIYGGTFAAVDLSAYNSKTGGIFQIYGATVNMYGGKIIGAKATTAGAINVSSGATLNMEGGSVEGGEATTANCVCAAASSIVRLSGNASVEEIYCAGAPSNSLTVSGTYTGTVAINPKTALADGAAIAKTENNADISGATITVVGTDYAPAISGSTITVGEGSWCEACQKTVFWQSLTEALPADASGHYKLTKKVSVKQVTIKSNNKICLDLAGYSYTGSSRAFLLGTEDGDYKVDLNIMDSSANQTGVLQGYGGSKTGGGVIYAYKNTKISIYSGTVRLASGGEAKTGGVIATNGTVVINLYDGKIIGGPANETGGAIHVRNSGTLNVAGGSIEGGTASGSGDCVYVADGATVILSGNGSVEQLYFPSGSDTELKISGKYTGTAQLKYATVPSTGAKIGVCTNAEILKENIAIAGSNMCAAVSGTNLVTVELVGASVISSEGKVDYYDTLEEAVAAYRSGDTIKLLADNSENVTIENATLDLYGCDLTGNVTITGKLYIKDSATDDFTVEDGKGYGKITATTDKIVAMDGYLSLRENSGTSYHKYVLKLDKINLRPGKTALYYTGDIKVDEAVLAMTERYGVAVSTSNAVPTADGADATSLYTALSKTDYGVKNTNSVLISNIMDGEDTDAVDATTTVYGRPYIKFTNNDYFYGDIKGANLRQVTEIIDAKGWGNLNLTQNRALRAMYDTHKTAMGSWTLKNLAQSVQKAAAAAEDNVLKVLVIGNSHGLDSVHLLADVFQIEGSQYDNVVLGAMYIGGCQVTQHVKQINGNLPYDYYRKHSGKDSSWVQRDDTTLLYALEDENWDVVLLQEMNRVSAIPDTDTDGRFAFGNSNIEKVYTYVVQNLGYEPHLMWNMIWTNPEIPEDYLKVVLGEESGDDTYIDPEENPDAGSSTLTAVDQAALQTWIFGGGKKPLTSHVSWSQQYNRYWNNDGLKMYEATVENVEKYVIGKSELGIAVDDVMPAATAVQYALERCGMPENGKRVMGGADKAMYRDYTHMSDYGRLMVAYLWYAELTGKTEITEVNYTTVLEEMRTTKNYGDLVLDQEQIDVIIESVNFALKNPLAGEELMTLD